jgi:hypothetical protein
MIIIIVPTILVIVLKDANMNLLYVMIMIIVPMNTVILPAVAYTLKLLVILVLLA